MKRPEELRRKIIDALSLDLPYPRAFFPEGRAAAVLLLFAEGSSSDLSTVSLLMTRRSERVESHKGQVALPGGAFDPADQHEEGLRTTALRETEEEVGISRKFVDILGCLPDLSTPSGYRVTPFVGWMTESYSQISLTLSPDEIAEAAWLRWNDLKNPEAYSRESIADGLYVTDVFDVRGFRIWGATAAILRNLLDRLQKIGDERLPG